jgi:hypothetical protein
VAKEHVIEWDHPNRINENEFDEGRFPIEYDLHDLPFMQEDSIDALRPRTQEYKEKLAKFQGKEPGSIKILKREKDKGDREC